MPPQSTSWASVAALTQTIAAAHQLYCHLTGQQLPLRFDRERMWGEWLRAGFSLPDLQAVILYLQREIRAGRRYVGALKLYNLLQPERFEDDLLLSRVRLRPPPRQPTRPPRPPPLTPAQEAQVRLRAVECLRQIKASLR